MVQVQLLVVTFLLVAKLVDAYVVYQQELGLVPLMSVNPYAIAQRNDLINQLNQLFSCPICCESPNEKNEEVGDKTEEMVYSPVDELAVLNVVPLPTTERTTVDDGEQLQRNNDIVKEFLEAGKTVKKEKAVGQNNSVALL